MLNPQSNRPSFRPGCIAWALAGSLLLTSVLPAMADKTPQKGPHAEEDTTPAQGKEPRPVATPTNTPDPEDTADTPAGTEAKPRKTPNPDASPTSPVAPTASISPEAILEFHAQPAGVQKLIESSLELARQNLTYTFGSADPANGGMDCSGFIYYLLRQYGLTNVPRDSSGQYVWARHTLGFRAVMSRKPDSFEMDELLPGDLMFWVGTYATDHDPPISHVMLYLGTEKVSGGKVMVGSSDGRSYRGQKRNGVSVFDFTMPRTPAAGDPRSTFIGYARIPGLRD